MNAATETYVSLIERATPAPTRAERVDPRPFARALLARTAARGPLSLGGPWHLHDSDIIALERAHGTPPGGWAGLAGVMADGPLLEIRGDALHARATPEELDGWSDARFSRSLLSALPERLVPPTTAAGLFLLMGLHPAWGLKLANAQRGERSGDAFEDATLFPASALEAVSHGVFGAIAALLEALRSLDAGAVYPVDGLSRITWSACALGRDTIRARTTRHPEDAIPVLFDAVGARLRSAGQRALDFTAVDLLDAYLVPAGVARRFDDQTFCVFPDSIPPDTHIPTHGPLHQTGWLQLMCA